MSIRGVAQRVALTLKTKGGLELLSFDDLYYKLKTLESFIADTEPEQQLAYEDFKQIEKLDLEEMDLKWKMAMLSVRVYKFEQKTRRKIDLDKKESTRFNKKKRYSSFKIKEIGKKEEDSKALITVDTLVDWTDHDGESDGVIASKEFGMIVGYDTEDAIKEGAAKTYNLITEADTEDISTAADAEEFALMGWDDSAFSVFTTDSEDVKGSPLINRFAKADSMKVVPPPLTRDYTSLSDHIDLNESQMSYGTNSSTFSDSKSVSNEFVSYDDNDKSLKDNTNDFDSSDSSVKSLEPKPNDSTSCASTSSVSIFKNEAEIESNVNIPPARPQPVPTSKPNVFAPVPTGTHNRPFPVPTDRGYSPSVIYGGWKRIDRQLLLSPQQVVLGNHIEKENPFLDAEDEKICGKKNRVLFTDTECMVALRVPRKHNLYTINLNNLCPRGNLACLVAHASVDESVKWHRRMGHVNYKNMNRLVKGNLVRGLPLKLFKNDHTCVSCCKGKQHKASYKAINTVSFIFKPLKLLHMDLFGPTSIRSIDHKYFCLVITDDYSRFCWVFFLEHKDETYPILKDFINLVEHQVNKKVKAMRCDNGTEFKNAHIIALCGSKGIKRE
nr:putative ribonuclease H-like domain-containing protein [Tanacetum cinerariifolium]